MKRIDLELNTAKCESFNDIYAELNHEMLKIDENVYSRNGVTKELLNFKTVIQNPLKRCVFGYGRNINIAFLIAEALWIFAGKKDLQFLQIFNSRMSDYSDDQNNFHAPYGFRMRNWGVDSLRVDTEENKHSSQGIDQIAEILKMIKNNPQDRRMVVSIWNPELDLNIDRKDIPCNDLLMFKVRNEKIHLTVQNRSNDLHWGLTTNVFQFSFLLEIICRITNHEVGTQTHNSQSLHIYTENDICSNLDEKYTDALNEISLNFDSIENISFTPIEMNFNFTSEDYIDRLNELDRFINIIIFYIKKKIKMNDFDLKMDDDVHKSLTEFSPFLNFCYLTLEHYVNYYKIKKDVEEGYINLCNIGNTEFYEEIDMFMLYKNFLLRRTNEKIAKTKSIESCYHDAKLQFGNL